MKFKVGKYYQDVNGRCLAILGEIETTMWGRVFLSEMKDGDISGLKPMGKNTAEVLGYKEITKGQWLGAFDR